MAPKSKINLEEKNREYKSRLIKEKMEGRCLDTKLATTTLEELYTEGKEDIGYTKIEIRRAVSRNYLKVKTNLKMPKGLSITYAINIIRSQTSPITDTLTGTTYYFKKQ